VWNKKGEKGSRMTVYANSLPLLKGNHEKMVSSRKGGSKKTTGGSGQREYSEKKNRFVSKKHFKKGVKVYWQQRKVRRGAFEQGAHTVGGAGKCIAVCSRSTKKLPRVKKNRDCRTWDEIQGARKKMLICSRLKPDSALMSGGKK